ncbi:hypothetical protein Vadar_005287 [Vaccinium darrowii]|uniref:Uncharacterized protein n=1 Tax=Vaccinium darrowii TaxID=229202 RepID=A0ACB7Z9Q4_9ERIC|nr:hypothetical protein Vadar_005287 [Vaccinium darrowii]
MVEDSSKGSTGKCSFSKICSNSGVTARKLMPKNKSSKKLSGKLLRPFRKNKRSQKDLDPELPEANKVKRGKSLGENPVNSGNPSNAKKHSYRSSFTSIERRKEETVTERDNKKVDNKLVSSTFVESYSLGEGPLQGKRGMFSPLPNRNRSWSSVHPLEEFKDPTKCSEQRMGAVMEAGVRKKRRKNGQGNSAFQVLRIQGKRPNVSLRTSEEAKDFKVSQPGSHLKFTAWSYPRGKRTHRNVPCHSKGVSDICPPSALVKEEKGSEDSMDIHKKSQVNSETTCYSTESHKNSQRNSETSCFSFYVRRKRRSSACSHQLQASTAKQCEEKSGELDHVVFSSSADAANESIELNILSNGNAEFSLSKCPSPVNFTEGINLVPAILDANEKGNQFLNRKLSRFPLTKELISLRFSGSLPNFTSKALRQRRDMANVRVLFSHNLDEDIIKQQKKILVRLGSSVASCCADATHFIADRFVWTRNMLESIALGKPVVTQLWVDSCGQASCFIDEKNYIPRDAKKEKEIGFSMPVSLAHSRQHPLLKGRRVIVTPNIRPSNEIIVSLVKAVHGQVVDRMEAAMTYEMIPVDVLILSCDQDYELCVAFLNIGAAVYSSELLLNGIIIQKLEFERHRLFKNHLKRNNSRTGLKKDGDRGAIELDVFAKLENLEELYLFSNELSGTIKPAMFGEKLRVLWLWSNKFSGAIELDAFAKLENLEDLDLSSNELSGTIKPAMFGKKLRVLFLSSNKFSGAIELDVFAKLENLEELYLSSNELSGTINPAMFGKKLRVLWLSSNKFSGAIELDVFAKLENLTSLDLSNSAHGTCGS